MTPNAFTKYREEFDKACKRFGWQNKTILVHHERDYDCSWEENIWRSDDEFLFSENNISEGLVKEIIRLAKNAGD